MSRKNLSIIGLVALVLIALLPGSCIPFDNTKLKVITGTSLVAAIVEKVGGNHVEVYNLVPPSQDPGNFTVKPEDIRRMSAARLFLLQGLSGETYVDGLVTSGNNPNLTVVKANVSGNWMIPSVQSAAVDKVLSALIQVDPDNTAAYRTAAESYKQAITDKETEIKDKLTRANVASVSVIASTIQADFLQWAGFNVVGTFDNAASLTPPAVKELVDIGQAKGVILVINNLQNSKDAGLVIAAALGEKNINLSEFPGGFANTGTWAKAIDYNVNLLINVIPN